jgi:heat shock protein HslJ
LKKGTILIAKLNGVSMVTEKLSGTWELSYISGPRIAFDVLYPDKKPFISFNFSAKELMGNTSCNGFSAKFNMNGNNIYFADALKTMMFCEGGGEETFLNMLKKVNRYSLNENALTFLIGDVAVMRFTKK